MDNLKTIDDKYVVPLKYTPAGTRILTQAPFTLVPCPSEHLHRCDYCLKKQKLQCCSRCHSAYFCGQDCFVSSWIQFHHYLCESTVPLDVEETLLAKTALMIHSMNTLTNKINTEQKLFLDLLLQPQQHEYRLSDKQKTKITKVTDLLQSMFTFDQLVTIHKIIQFSSFTITDPDSMHMDPIGIGIYPITSRYIQHSCTPNSAWIYEGNQQIIVAIQDIPQDTPITVNFTNLVATRQQRLNSLKTRFSDSFSCNCSRCDGEFENLDKILERQCTIPADQMEQVLTQQIRDWDKELSELTHGICRMIVPEFYAFTYNPAIKKKSFSTFLHHQLPPYLATQTRQENARRIVPILKILVEKETPYLSVQAVQAAEKLYPALIQDGRWVEASRCAMYLLMVYRLVYPALYPLLVYHRLVVCRTSWNSLVQLELMKHSGKEVERLYEKGVSLYIESAKVAISKIFGKRSSMWKEVVEIQWLFERDQKLK